MALVKNSQAKQMTRSAVVLDLGDLHVQGQRLIAQAKQQAEKILADARKEREQLITGAAEEGHAQGHAAGHAEGLEEGRQEGREQAIEQAHEQFASLQQTWTEALASFSAQRDDILDDARDAVLELAIEIAQRVISRAIAADPASVREQLAKAIELAAHASRLVVAVHPDDIHIAKEALPDLVRALTNDAHTEVTPDPALTPGSCVIRTPAGEIDASIETQVARIIEALSPAPRKSQTPTQHTIDNPNPHSSSDTDTTPPDPGVLP